MKKVIQIVLAVVIVFLAFVVYRQLTIPLKFQKEVETRSAAVIDRIKDDSVAVARGLVSRETFKVAVIDTIFGSKQMTPEKVEMIRYIPYTDGMEFILEAGQLKTESGVTVQVFECRAPYKAFLADLNRQELINLIDERENTFNDYPGIKVGSMTSATNDAGNWE